ncbi:MAG: FMN-binding negative transcriptional regulator [Pseudomonadaceae bacterium]|nr:FMN-binding negative transcriptional regulator [Pseudomonadaceae bacterium]
MYLPSHFEESDQAQLFDLIDQHPLATLIRHHDIEISHLPFRLNRERHVLEAHMPRANPLAAETSVPVTLVFHAENHYVSPGWYATKASDPRVVPTWNYSVVHVTGTLRLIDDPGWLTAHLTAATDTHETAIGGDWKVSDAPTDFTDRLIRTLTGLEVDIDSIIGKFKRSQNRPIEDQRSVSTALQSRSASGA